MEVTSSLLNRSRKVLRKRRGGRRNLSLRSTWVEHGFSGLSSGRGSLVRQNEERQIHDGGRSGKGRVPSSGSQRELSALPFATTFRFRRSTKNREWKTTSTKELVRDPSSSSRASMSEEFSKFANCFRIATFRGGDKKHACLFAVFVDAIAI